jgi:hypothetical protein
MAFIGTLRTRALKVPGMTACWMMSIWPWAIIGTVSVPERNCS